MKTRAEIIKPGLFSREIAADRRRLEFDYKNEVIVSRKTPIDFVFIGDSITQRWELNAYFKGVSGMIANRGIGSDTTEYLLKRFDADVIQLNPKHVVMEIGINDVYEIDDDLELCVKGRDEKKVKAKIIENVNSAVNKILKTGIRMVLCSVLPIRQEWNNKSKEKNELILQINENYKLIAQENNLIYVDYHLQMIDIDGLSLKKELSEDGVHPHVLGYDIMADVLKKTLLLNGIVV